MNKITGALSALALTVGMAGGANAADCANGPVDVSNAILHMSDAGDLFEDTSLKSRFKGRMEVRRAIADIAKAKLSLLDCGLLPIESNIQELIALDLTHLEVVQGFDISIAEGQIANETALTVAANLASHALVHSHGAVDVNAMPAVMATLKVLEAVESNL